VMVIAVFMCVCVWSVIGNVADWTWSSNRGRK